MYDVYMTSTTTCAHKHCGLPLDPYFARYKYVEGKGMVPMHSDCSYAHPDDTREGKGSPFTTIVSRAI
jgi:hypothetical protein